MGINFPLTFLQPSSYLQPMISSWHQALLNRWLAQGLTHICSSLALVRDEWYKKNSSQLLDEKNTVWSIRVELLFSMSVVLNLAHFQRSAESRGNLWKEIKKLSDIIVVRNNNSDAGHLFNQWGFLWLCFTQQLRELNTCFREIFHSTCFLRIALSPLIQKDQFLIILTNW